MSSNIFYREQLTTNSLQMRHNKKNLQRQHMLMVLIVSILIKKLITKTIIFEPIMSLLYIFTIFFKNVLKLDGSGSPKKSRRNIFTS